MKKILKLIIVILVIMPFVVLADSLPSFIADEFTAEVGNKGGAKTFTYGFKDDYVASIPYGAKVAIMYQNLRYVSVIYNNKQYYIDSINLKTIADDLTAEITDSQDVYSLYELGQNAEKGLIPRGAKVSNVQKVDLAFVTYKGESYYVKPEDLKNFKFSHIHGKLNVRYLLVDVTLRKAPSNFAEEVGTLKAETKVKCSDDYYNVDGWVYITDGNISGYFRNPEYNYFSGGNAEAFLGQRLENIPYYYTRDVITKYDNKTYRLERKDEEYDKYGLKFLTLIDVKYVAETWKFGSEFFMKYNGKLVPIHSSNVLEDYNYKLMFKSFECKDYSYDLCRVFDLEGNKLNLEDVFKLNKEYQIKYISYPKYTYFQQYSNVDNLYIDVDGKLYILQYPTDEVNDRDIIIDAKKKEPLTEEEKQKQIKESIKTKVIEESPDDITKKSVNNYIIKIGVPIISIVISAGIIIIFINKERKIIKETK
ncbi:MAG: hypothetical protein GX951_00850 [Mollicutes bacterium]|nr:hypothetical protein [Mollicutes bacterium]